MAGFLRFSIFRRFYRYGHNQLGRRPLLAFYVSEYAGNLSNSGEKKQNSADKQNSAYLLFLNMVEPRDSIHSKCLRKKERKSDNNL